tara:strand:+ start:2256 stop:2471 length:216 start_codon:yes stop_codon:yes gene_type:complete
MSSGRRATYRVSKYLSLGNIGNIWRFKKNKSSQFAPTTIIGLVPTVAHSKKGEDNNGEDEDKNFKFGSRQS